MKKLKTAELREGMRFTKSVYIDQNNILVGPNVPVKKKDIDRLLAWGILELETAGDVLDLGQVHPDDDYRPDDVSKKEDELKRAVEEQQRQRGGKPAPAAKSAPAKPAAEEDLDVFAAPAADGPEHEVKYREWLSEIGRLFYKVKNNGALETGKANLIVREIIEIVPRRKSEVVSTMSAVDRGEYLHSHSVNVAVLATIVGQSLGFDKETLARLVLGALLLDIGMVRIPAYIIEKEGKLTPEEYNKIKTHPLHGYKILTQENRLPHEVALVALEHHEHCDGTGYPRGLKEGQISVFGKIAAVTDTYEAMTKRRSYRDEYLSYEAMKNVLSVGQQKFDQNILRTFLKTIGVYPVGSYVQLNNNCVGVVVEADPKLPMRPTVRILRDEFGDGLQDEEIVKLAAEKDLFILRALAGEGLDEPGHDAVKG